jgi:hypothetical protein
MSEYELSLMRRGIAARDSKAWGSPVHAAAGLLLE